MSPATTYELPGLPALRWDEYSWEARDTLPSWARFQARGGAYGGRTAGPSEGAVRVSIHTPYDEHAPPHDAQVAAWRWLKEHDEVISAAVLARVLSGYPAHRAAWLADFPDDEDALPVIDEPSGLAAVIGLHDVHIHATVRDGVAYVGFELGCDWDDERGLGVVTHRDRVIEVGHASVSFSRSVAIHHDGGVDLDRA